MADGGQELSRLRWRCRRGMRELDDLLLRYLESGWPVASERERDAFAYLLELSDPDLIIHLLRAPAPTPGQARPCGPGSSDDLGPGLLSEPGIDRGTELRPEIGAIVLRIRAHAC